MDKIVEIISSRLPAMGALKTDMPGDELASKINAANSITTGFRLAWSP